ncbi:cyclin ccl1 [Apiospora arundinis]|uniref:COX assembly mitochondrial protein n=1 Tax=Apiospora arundinis TaxID=335852 RepID=A0ABR2JDT1_9PEZI
MAEEILRNLERNMDSDEGDDNLSRQVQSALSDLVRRGTGYDHSSEPEGTWLRDLDICVSQVNETHYVSGFCGALADLQEHCLGYERLRRAKQREAEREAEQQTSEDR